MRFISYAQNGEDVVLWRALGEVTNGFYVDVGAAHPDEDSVTRAFYDRGWHGINVEPVPALAARIAAARPRDKTLAVAAGAADGRITLHVVPDTGLSTTDAAVLASLGETAAASTALDVPLRRLDAILDEHAPDRIDFLKIDVEGAERAVLEGCNFKRHRPRVILLEATWPNTDRPTHDSWEDLLLDARYRFILFDGLNRFYVAEEWAALTPRLAAPANVLDNFVHVADAAEARRAAAQEGQLGALMERARAAEDSARAAYARAFEQARDLGNMRQHLGMSDQGRQDALARRDLAESHTASLERELAATRDDLAEAKGGLAEATRLLAATRASNSWQMTGPLRAISTLVRPRRGTDAVEPAEPNGYDDGLPPAAPAIVVPASPVAPVPVPSVILRTVRGPGPIRSVHQFHSGSATGDAVTNSMFLIRRELRRRGYRSEIFVEHRDPGLAHELHMLQDLPERSDHLLIVHHSMGYDSIDRILAHSAPKLLYYHNITPPPMLPADSPLPAYAALGREQLGLLRQAVTASVAASEYNAVDLRRAGFDPVWVSTLLVDVDQHRSPGKIAPPRRADHPFTVLFVGRLIESKAQPDLVEAFGRFRARLGRPARLVLVGRTDSPGRYLQTIDDGMRAHGLEAELVVTGPVSDAELRAQYAAADLYVSLSRHEGFGVPLVEAMARDIPVLAWPAGAIPYTVGGEAGLLHSRDPEDVATAMLAVANDPARRSALLDQQRMALDRFALDRQWPAMQAALTFAGAVPPVDRNAGQRLAAHVRYAVFGHTAGSYSLATVNRRLADALEAERPGRVRLVPVEGTVNGLPAHARQLAERERFETGPVVVVSQHYPVLAPEPRGDVNLALVFWEESLLPPETIAALEQGFDGVLAPSIFVAKALTDSGLGVPVHVIGQAPELAPFEAIACGRDAANSFGRPFTFLHVSSCFPRKGVDVLLAAYARAFRSTDSVRLVIKGFPNPHNTVPDQVAAVRRAHPDLAPIEVIDRDLDEDLMLHLYREADAMVLPTRGEGYNLPAAEAMASGLPLIVTGLGGHLDFCGEQTARLLRYKLAPSASHLASGHSLWAEPDLDDLVAALREIEGARRDPYATAELAARTQRARAEIRQHTSGRAMVRRLEHAALDALLRPPPSAVRVAWVTSWGVRCGVAEYSRHLINAVPPHPQVSAHLVLPDDRVEPMPGASPSSRPAWRLHDPASVPRLESAIVAEDPRAIVIQHQPGLMPWDMLATLLESPVLEGRVVIVTLHSSRNLLDYSGRDRVCAALRRVARVAVHSIGDLTHLQQLGIAANVTFVPHGVREALPRTVPHAVGNAPLIGSYGFFLPNKGIGELIQAVSLLRASRPGARLRLVNADYLVHESGSEIARCRALAEAAGLGDAVEWHTEFLPDDESVALLAACDMIVIPTQSSQEGSSASVRTALAAGPPVMTTPLAMFDDVADAVLHSKGRAAADLAGSLDAMLSDLPALQGVQAAAEAWLRSREWRVVGRLFGGMVMGLVAAQEIVSRELAPSQDRCASGSDGPK